MRRVLAVLVTVALTVAVAPVAAPVAGAAPARASTTVSRADLALRWAPVLYQDVDATGAHALGGRSDLITAIDFDGTPSGRDNWDNAARADASFAAHAYYSVVETATHWYLTYLFFHPRDWTDHPFFETEHENDGEGALFVVERDGSPYGTLRAAVTVAHSDFYSYTPAGSTWTAGRESVDGTLLTRSSPHDPHDHPVLGQEAQGHGLKAYPQYAIDGDGVVYHPSTVAETPDHPDDRDVRYRLVDLFAPDGLWARRADAALFVGFGTFAGDDSDSCGAGTWGCPTDAANAPWGWDDPDDLPGRGEIATDPARLSSEYFTVGGGLSRDYTHNPYGGVQQGGTVPPVMLAT